METDLFGKLRSWTVRKSLHFKPSLIFWKIECMLLSLLARLTRPVERRHHSQVEPPQTNSWIGSKLHCPFQRLLTRACHLMKDLMLAKVLVVVMAHAQAIITWAVAKSLKPCHLRHVKIKSVSLRFGIIADALDIQQKLVAPHRDLMCVLEHYPSSHILIQTQSKSCRTTALARDGRVPLLYST